MSEHGYDEVNEAKADMEHIYDRPDPRSYFHELRKLDYIIPGNAKPVFSTLIDHLGKRRETPIQLLDIGCSYGVNGALLKYDLELAELSDHWGREDVQDRAADEQKVADCRYFDAKSERPDLEVVGIDPAESAISYATRCGTMDEGFALDLENGELPDEAAATVAATDLAISTGCVGYVTEKSFERLMPAMTRGEKPWLANFVLRMFPFDAIAKSLEKWGYVTEKLEGETFFQRRFASREERGQVLETLDQIGVDSTGLEREGSYYAEFFLSRPAEDAKELPLKALALA